MEATVVDWDAVPAEGQGSGGVRKRRVGGEGAELVLVEVPAGTRAPRHSHPHEQFVQVLAGGGTLETEAGAREFRQGSVFHFPPGAWHAAEFASDTVLVETNMQATPSR
jgi:quercetin dioxygenase-like cupin family protein